MTENSEHTQSHIDSMAKQEQAFLENRTLSERAGDSVAGFAGSLVFVTRTGSISVQPDRVGLPRRPGAGLAQ